MKESVPQSEYPFNLSQVHERAVQVMGSSEIHPRDFLDLYGATNITEDEKYVMSREQIFADGVRNNPGLEQLQKLGSIFEAVVHDRGGASGWFGYNAQMIKTSRFDDIKNGVDEVVEFRQPLSSEYLALAIDTTYHIDRGTNDNFEKIRQRIENGQLARIKYFKNAAGTIRAELSRVPLVIIGAEKKTVISLASLWAKDDIAGLDSHPIQFQILEEVLIQATTFKEYALKVGQKEAAHEYEKIESKIKALYEARQNVAEDSGERDMMFENLKAYLRSNFK